MSLQGYWSDQKAPAFENLPSDLVVVQPVGAVEQHGPHLPLSVDCDLVEAVITRGMSKLSADQNVLILPTLTVTKSDEHDHFPGTLSLSADTLLAKIRDIGASLSRANIERLVFLNGHGGNAASLDITARDLRIQHDMIAATASWFGFADYSAVEPEHILHDFHGGLIETSAMLATKPELVDMDLAENFEPASMAWEQSYKFIGLTRQAAKPAWIAGDLHPKGVCGDAASATVELGNQLLDSAARDFAAFLAEFARFDGRQSEP
ncbi:MAG: creatininase family protein [Pseudomonadota bacterium]